MSYNYLNSLNSSLEKQNNIQEQLSDGKSIHRPSDNPVRAVRSLKFATSLAKNVQFSQNLSDAQSWMNNTDGVMSDMSSIMIKAKELVVSADDTKTPGDIHTIGAQIDGLINQVVSLGNTKVGDRYLFAGQNDSTQPFERKTIKDPNSNLTKEIVVYNGDTSLISMPIQDGASNTNRDSVNLNGTNIFGSTSTVYGQQTLDVLNHLLEIKDEMEKTSSVQQTNQNGGIGTVGGKYTGAGFKSYDVRVDGVDHSGRVTGASYSTDGGNSWTAVGKPGTGSSLDTTKNPAIVAFDDGVKFNITDGAKVDQTNPNGGAIIVTKSAVSNYKVQIDAVGAGGQVTAASYSINGGAFIPFNTGNTATKAAELDSTSDPNNTALTLPDGRVINIAKNANNAVSNTYDVDASKSLSIIQSNSLGGAATISGSSGSYQICFTSVVGGQVQGAAYSTDNGANWINFNTANEIDISNSQKTSLTLPNGRVIDIAKNNNNIPSTVPPSTPSDIKDTYRVDFNSTGSTISQSNVLGGNASVVDNSGYKVRVGAVVAAPAANAGQITGASYSTDGVHWTPLPTAPAPASPASIDATTSTAQSTVALPDGTVISLKTNPNTVAGDIYSVQPQTSQGDVYSFRVPQDAFQIGQSNAKGGAVTLSGNYAGTANISYSVKIDGTDSNGTVTQASYSTDNGASWTSISNYKVSQTNSNGATATVGGSTGLAMPCTVDNIQVDSDGKVTGANVNGVPAATITYETATNTDTNTSSTVAVISLGAGGQVLRIPTNKLNTNADTYNITADPNSPITITPGVPPTTALKLQIPNTTQYLSLSIDANANNTLNDRYSFTLPQGKGPDTKWLSAVGTQYIDDDHKLQLKAQTELGARMSMYEMTSNMMDNERTQIEDDQGTNDGLDMAQAITDYNTIQNVYRAALAVGGKIMQTSLVDFLK